MSLSVKRLAFFTFSLLAGMLAGTALRPSSAAKVKRHAVALPPALPAPVEVPRALSADEAVEEMLTRVAALHLQSDSHSSPEATQAERAAAVALACAGRSSEELPALFAWVVACDWPLADKQSALGVIAHQWAEHDPQAALAAIRTLDLRTLPGAKEPFHYSLVEGGRDTVEITWARRDPAGFRDYIMEDARRKTAKRGWYRPSSAVVRAEPRLAMDMLLATDEAFFRKHPKSVYPGSPYETGDASTSTDLNRAYASWITRCPTDAAAWAGQTLAARELPPGLAFYMIDQLNENGASAAAARLAAAHLPEDLAAKALERVLPRWQAADRPAADAWMQQNGKPK